jgi:hypothetical protein
MKFEELTPEEQRAAKAFAEAIRKPPEHYNEIINSGMCNSIIEGYILLALDEAGIDLTRAQRNSISRVFDNYSAEDARKRAAIW